MTVYTKAAAEGVLLKKVFTGKHLYCSLFLIRFLCLSEADQSLLKKETAEYLQSGEISFELLYDLHYINTFF